MAKYFNLICLAPLEYMLFLEKEFAKLSQKISNSDNIVDYSKS